MLMMNIMKRKNNMIFSPLKTSVVTYFTGINLRFRWLLALALLSSIAMPVIMYAGRVEGAGEFDYLIYYRLLFFHDYYNSLAMLAALLAALLLRLLWSRVEQLAQWITLYPLKTCIFAFVIIASVGRLIYQAFPLAMDEYVPLLQARIFAQGSLTFTYPPELLDRMVIPGFQGQFIHVNYETGQIASVYWPGLALLMTPFAFLELEWLLNPLLAAVGLWIIGDLAYQASRQPQARGWAILAALACPQYIINAMSYYSMTATLTFNLLYLWLLLKRDRRSTLLAGLVGAFALVMHNPIPHSLFAMPCIVWLLSSRSRYTQLILLAIGYIPSIPLIYFLKFNSIQDSIPYDNVSFIEAWLQQAKNVFIFPDINMVIIRAYALCKMVIWTAPGLILLLFFVRPITLIQRILLCGLVFSFVFHLFIPYDQGHGWGYRYIHAEWGLVAIGAGIFAVSGYTFQRNFIAASLLAGLLATPVFALQTGRTIALSKSIQPALPATQDDSQFFVFITPHAGLYTMDLIRNYPKDEGKIIRMVSYGAEEDAVLARQFSSEALQISVSSMGSVWQLPKESHITSIVN